MQGDRRLEQKRNEAHATVIAGLRKEKYGFYKYEKTSLDRMTNCIPKFLMYTLHLKQNA